MFKNKILQPATITLGAIAIMCLLFAFGQTPSASSATYQLNDPADFAPLLQLDADSDVIEGKYIVVLKENPTTTRLSAQALEQMVDASQTLVHFALMS